MFVFNIKMKSKNLIKAILILTFSLAIILLIFSISSIYKKSFDNSKVNNDNEIVYEISSNDYTNFLKDAHENIDNYIDKKVKMVGYVYRMPDFSDKQFVLSRTMILNSANTGVVVGILAEYENANNYLDNEWIEVTGTIVKGNYNGDMPVLKVEEIKKCEIPDDEYVYPPSLESTDA